MAIFVTEDDVQGGRDHIDAHRTVFMGIGPYFKRTKRGLLSSPSLEGPFLLGFSAVNKMPLHLSPVPPAP
jgi:hypothetical protein